MSWRVSIFLCVTIMLVGYLFHLLIDNDIEARQSARQQIYNFGKNAAESGVPSTANPYQGMPYRSQQAVDWLSGWMDGIKKD